MSVGGFGNSGDGIVTDGLILSVDPYNKKSYVSKIKILNSFL